MQIHGLTPLLQVFDIATSIAFYRDVLGFAVVSLSGASEAASDWAMLKRGDSTLMLNAAYERHERPPEPDASRVKAHVDTALFFACDSADSVYAYLRAKGCNVQEPVTTHYGMRQVYMQDPDGFELCFQHPAEQSAAVAPGE